MKKLALFGAIFGLFTSLINAQGQPPSPQLEAVVKITKNALNNPQMSKDLRTILSKHIAQQSFTPEQNALALELVALGKEFTQLDHKKASEETKEYWNKIRAINEKYWPEQKTIYNNTEMSEKETQTALEQIEQKIDEETDTILKGPKALKMDLWQEKAKAKIFPFLQSFFGELENAFYKDTIIMWFISTLIAAFEQGLTQPEQAE